MSKEYFEQLIIQANKTRISNIEKLRRRIELGYIKGKLHQGGSIIYPSSPKKFNIGTIHEL